MELIVEDAVVVSMASDSRDADAVLVRDGRVASVGSAEKVRAAARSSPSVVRLSGATIVPGLIDAHCHVSNVAYLALGADCGQPSAPDIPTIQARLRQAADRTPASSWVVGSGFLEYKLREQRYPTRADLDEALPSRPVILLHASLHVCVLNTPALREAGLDDQQPDPPDGRLGRDGSGRLDGIIYEGPVFPLLERNRRRDISQMTADQRTRFVQGVEQHFTRLGITTTCDADLRRDGFAVFAEADAHGALSLRVHGLFPHDEADWLVESGARSYNSDRLTVTGIKIWADGGMSSRTAAIHGTYPVPPYGSGIMYYEPRELLQIVRDLDAHEFQIGIHAQGDRAIETCLDVFAAVLPGGRENRRRHRIEHGGAMYPELIARAAHMGIVVVTQPGFVSVLGDGFAAAFGDRSEQLYPLNSWLRAGVATAGSSDAPVITADPLIGIRDAVVRRTAEGRVLGPDERLTIHDALALYTKGAAFALRRERELGTLEPGKHADFVVLDSNPFDTLPERLGNIGVLATVIGGRPVYQREQIMPDE
jgi:predicted amidohydrolase YtcJ